MTQRPPTGPQPSAGPLAGADASPEYVQRRTQDGIAVLTMAGPDGNRMGPDLVRALSRAVASAYHDDGVRALVLTARGADSCAGPWTDLPPPGPEVPELPPVLADLAALCETLENADKPLVCAVHGRVTSGGLALALAAHGIVADSRATLHFPEPRLGRLPPGNGTVRLCWRLGAREALRVLHAPAPLSAASLPALVTQTVSENLLPTAIALADALAMQRSPHPQTPGLDDPPEYRATLAKARATLPQPLPAQRAHDGALLDVVEAAQLLPTYQALAFDLVHAQDAALAPVARSLAHLARATRRALDTPEARLARGAPLRSSPVTVALSPENAARLIPSLLRSGVEATLTAPNRDPLARALEAVAEAQLDQVKSGRMLQSDSEGDWNRLSGRLQADGDATAVGFADVEHLAWLEAQIGPDTPLIVWSPGAHPLPALVSQNRVVTLVPAPSRAPRLCEIVLGPDTDADPVRHATTLALRLKLTPIRTLGTPILPLLTHAVVGATHRLRALGVTSATLRATQIVHIGAELGEAAETQTPLPLPVDRLVLLAVVNAGARLLREGISLRPSDLDLAMVLGAGWPNWRGGPMAEADVIGPMVLRHELKLAAELDADLWTPDPLFDQMIRDGARFEALNTAAL